MTCEGAAGGGNCSCIEATIACCNWPSNDERACAQHTRANDPKHTRSEDTRAFALRPDTPTHPLVVGRQGQSYGLRACQSVVTILHGCGSEDTNAL